MDKKLHPFLRTGFFFHFLFVNQNERRKKHAKIKKTKEEFIMLVGDLVYNDYFDCNCNYRVYDCTAEDTHYDKGAKCIYDAVRDGNRKPLDAVLDMQVLYLTVTDNCIIIEAGRNL